MDRSRWTACAVVAALAAALHLRTLAFPFLFDDVPLIVENAALRQPWSALRAFAHDFWYGSNSLGYYRPLINASFALNGRLSGWEPWGFHLVNVVLHALNTALLFVLARRLWADDGAAWLGAVVFALHPVAAWPVGSIVARVDLLSATFVLLAWLALASGDAPNGRKSLLAGALFLLALLCKESAIAFLAVPLMGLRPERSARGRLADPSTLSRRDDAPSADRRTGAVRSSLYALAAVLIYLGIRRSLGIPFTLFQEEVDPLVNPLARLPLPGRLYAALELSGRYLLYLLVPVRFSDPNGYVEGMAPPAPTDPGVILSALFLTIGCLTIAWRWLRRDGVALPLAFALGSFLPASNLLTPIASLYAQNFLYMPLLGACVALAGLLAKSLPHLSIRGPQARFRTTVVALSVVAPILFMLGVGSYREAGTWRDGLSLFTTWTSRFPNYPFAYHRLGMAHLEAGDPSGAVTAFRRALALYDKNPETNEYLSLALQLSARGKDDLEEALRLNRSAVGLLSSSLAAARARGSMLLLMLGRTQDAEAEALEAKRLAPELPAARSALAEIRFGEGRFSEAADEYRELVRLQPGDPNVMSPYVVSLIRAHRLEEARSEIGLARIAFPGLAWFDFCLARVEARSGRRAEAIALLKEAFAKDPATRNWIGQVEDFGGYRGNPEFDSLLAGTAGRKP